MKASGSALFPDRTRDFPGKRWSRIALRSLHLVGVGGVGGGMLFGLPESLWMPWWWLTILTGATLVVIEIWSNGVWLLQVAGMSILAKIVLLACVPLFPQHAGSIFVVVVMISGVISHAPAAVRHYSVLHGRRVDTLGESPASR